MRSSTARWFAASLAGISLAILGITATPSRAGTDVDLRVSMYPDADAWAIGGGLLTDVGGGNWFFNPNLEIGMGDNLDLMLLSGDFHYDFASASNLSLWAGGGPAVLMTNPPNGDNQTDLGLNALMGMGARGGGLRPFGQVRGTFADESQFSIAGGIRF